MRKLEINSPAKLNLYLKVIKKRKDGYHEIVTLLERISLFDRIVLEKRWKKIEILSYGRKIPLGKNNLAYKAALFFSQKIGKELGVRIKIFKEIPVGGGLGGGSSNAASVLLGMNRLYELGIDKKILYQWGSILGSDVNFFISEEKFALGYGRGEKIYPLDIDIQLWHLLIYPGFSISTKKVYEEFNEIGLTKRFPHVKILKINLYKGKIEKIGSLFFNSLEPIVLRKYPILNFWKNKLASTSAKGVLVSGSGSSIFGLYLNRKEADGARRELKRFKRKGEFFVVSTDCLS